MICFLINIARVFQNNNKQRTMSCSGYTLVTPNVLVPNEWMELLPPDIVEAITAIAIEESATSNHAIHVDVNGIFTTLRALPGGRFLFQKPPPTGADACPNGCH